MALADKNKRKLPLREMNNLLDTLAISLDAEAEAREAARERLTRRSLPRLKK
jgi:hypothetical protein